MKKRSFLLALKLVALSNMFFVTNSIAAFKDVKFELGRALFFDKVLSGNKNISCATCHHPDLASGDAVALSIGEGGSGLGVKRTLSEGKRAPRNAPALFNLRLMDDYPIFFDGRVEEVPGSNGFIASPAKNNLPEGLEDILSVQALFPLLSAVEMAGQKGSNEIADAAAKDDKVKAWSIVVNRVKNIDGYMSLFQEVFPSVKSKNDLGIQHIANALAHYEDKGYRAVDSPYDRYKDGELTALNFEAKKGMKLFYGKAKCSQCHTGKFQTDGKFYNLAIPPVGPGKEKGLGGKEDFGRELVTKKRSDRYKFRTPTLRNVVLTGPWGHNGVFQTLEEVIDHHLNPEGALINFDFNSFLYLDDEDPGHTIFDMTFVKENMLTKHDLPRVELNHEEKSYLIEFLYSLTDLNPLSRETLIPEYVPSGLPVKD